MQPDASQRSDLLDIRNDDEMQKVNDHRKQYMTWSAEMRLRTAAWYTYQVAFRVVDVACQIWTATLRHQIMHNTDDKPEEQVGDDEWCAI